MFLVCHKGQKESLAIASGEGEKKEESCNGRGRFSRTCRPVKIFPDSEPRGKGRPGTTTPLPPAGRTNGTDTRTRRASRPTTSSTETTLTGPVSGRHSRTEVTCGQTHVTPTV